MDPEQKFPHKILVAVPTMGIEADPNKWLKSYLNVLNDIRSNGLTHAPMFIYRDTWFSAMNKVFDTAISHGFDYILRMDDDIWAVGLDYFSRLYKADKDVIGALYPTRYFPYSYAALTKVDPSKDIIKTWEDKENNFTEVIGKGIQKVDLIGFGMTLINLEKFKMVPRPFFPKEEICPDDTWFAKLCAENDIEQYVHMDLKMAHREITPMNRLYIMNADARMMLQNGLVKDDGKNPFLTRLIENFGSDGKKDLDKIIGI